MEILRLVPIYCGAQTHLLAPLSDLLIHTFGGQVERHPPSFDPELAFDRSRGQYNSRVLLALLLDDAPSDAHRILGVTSVDLFMPVLTYVFGEAQLGGRAAIVSLRRLDNAVYGMPSDASLLFERLAKEAVHELGHTYALMHCARSDCVMTSSTVVAGIDMKGMTFCTECRSRLRFGTEKGRAVGQ